MSGKFMMNGIEYLGGGSGGGGNVNDVYVNGTSVLDSDKIAQITSYKEITQSEYEALPASKLTDGIAYFIKDATEAEGYPPLIYSTSEREIGVWIDGKPLYEKVITFSTAVTVSTNWTDINIGIPIDMIVYASVYRTSDGFYNILKASQANNSGEISIRLESGYFDADAVLIRYTKSTDTAGSGIWAGNGAMAHHYSTDEVIVGTWIDGKPLYERIFEQTTLNLVANTWSQTAIPRGNMKYIVDAWVVVENDSSPSIHRGMSGGFVSDYLALNSFRAISLNVGHIAYVVVQYTKTID